jgi:2-haloacid dehalogenase
MNKINSIIFDFGGVLIDWNPRYMDEGTRVLLDRFPEHVTKIKLYYDQWEKMIKGQISPNVNVLRKLKEHYKLFGLTNWSAETFPIVFNRYPFFKLFDGIVISGEEKLIKPDKKIFELLLERYHLKAENALFIDDNIYNIQAANEMGFATIHVRENTDLENELQALGLI